MIFTPAMISNVMIVELEKREDDRGYFARAWCEREFAEQALPRFVQTNMSMSKRKGTIRGLHYQLDPHGEAKYIRCIRGAIFDVVVDIRKESPTFKQWIGIELTSENRKGVYIPEGLPHAYQALTEDAEVIYSTSSVYTPGAECGVRWNDPTFRIDWPIKQVIVSEKDSSWPDWKG